MPLHFTCKSSNNNDPKTHKSAWFLGNGIGRITVWVFFSENNFVKHDGLLIERDSFVIFLLLLINVSQIAYVLTD